MNNYSHTKINLPLFYYNKKENLNNTSKSNNITDKKDFNININNSVFTPNSKRIDSKIYENNRQNYTSENNLRNRSEPTSPYYNNINTNLINQDLNLIGSNNGFNNKDISSIINKIREIFILRGIKSIFYFQKMLYVYDINHTGEISFTNLQNIIQAYNYNFSQEEMQSLFENFDKEKKGFIKYNELFMEIIGNMNILRFTLVKQLFDLFPKNQYGNINFDVFKNSFYPNRHFDVLNGNKTTDEVYGEFLECLQIFKEYITNLKGNISKNDLTYEEFCDFFGEISSEIKNDSIFSNYIENCWKIIN
jgi:Ca2+-binding EF-hand superfamily protein